MSTDFEDTLRDLLVDAADGQGHAYLEPDTDLVLAHGRRVVRRRRLTVGAGIAASALVLGLGSWAVLNQSSGHDAVEPVPATRSSSVAARVVSATLPAEDGSPMTSYTVSLDRESGRVTATSELPDGNRVDAGMIGRIGEGEQKAVWATVSRDPFIVVGLVPAEADELMTRFGDGDVGGARTSEAALTTTAYKAFLVQTEKSPPGAELAGLDWSAGGRIFDVEGHELPSATIGDHTVYLNDAAGELGVVTPDGSARVPLQSATSGGSTPHLTTAVKEEGKPTVTTFAIVLPVDSGDISLEVAPGATLVSQQSAPLLGGTGVAVVATVQAPDVVDRVVRQVAWTADGRRSTWRDVG